MLLLTGFSPFGTSRTTESKNMGRELFAFARSSLWHYSSHLI